MTVYEPWFSHSYPILWIVLAALAWGLYQHYKE